MLPPRRAGKLENDSTRSNPPSNRVAIRSRCRQRAPADETIDITLPGTRRALGAEHPLIRTMNEIVTVFAAMGYSVGLGPEVETDYYNFESLNFPPAIRRATPRTRW